MKTHWIDRLLGDRFLSWLERKADSVEAKSASIRAETELRSTLYKKATAELLAAIERNDMAVWGLSNREMMRRIRQRVDTNMEALRAIAKANPTPPASR